MSSYNSNILLSVVWTFSIGCERFGVEDFKDWYSDCQIEMEANFLTDIEDLKYSY